MNTVGVILSTVGDTDTHGGYHDARGGYHEYRGGVQYHEGEFLLFEYPTVLNTSAVLVIFPTCIMISPQYSNYKGWYPPTVLNTPTVLIISPTCIMISPTVLSIHHGTQDTPTFTMIPPRYCTPPPYRPLPPPYGTAHTLYRVKKFTEKASV